GGDEQPQLIGRQAGGFADDQGHGDDAAVHGQDVLEAKGEVGGQSWVFILRPRQCGGFGGLHRDVSCWIYGGCSGRSASAGLGGKRAYWRMCCRRRRAAVSWRPRSASRSTPSGIPSRTRQRPATITRSARSAPHSSSAARGFSAPEKRRPSSRNNARS